jgi:putative acetyltransferase
MSQPMTESMSASVSQPTTQVRVETAADVPAIRDLNVAVFPTDAEARLVDALRANAGLVLSLVAEEAEILVGHIAFSPITVTADGGAVVTGVGLAPMAVAPFRQRSGVGRRLIEEGLRRLAEAGHRFCVVLGHPTYYPRHGFVVARSRDIRWERAVPDEVFMVRALVPDGLDGVAGVARYRPEFDAR